jgi:putative redox protein
MDAVVNWKGRMTFEGFGPSQMPLQLDSDLSTGGSGEGFRPMELIALGLAGCGAMDVLSILLKKQQNITDFQVHFQGDRSHEFPQVFTQSSLDYHFYGKNLDEKAVLRAIELSVEKYCPVHAMLEKAFPIRVLYKIFDSDSKELMKEGEYNHPETP